MHADTHDNTFVGKIPGMDCKSEWLLTYGRSQLLKGLDDDDLDVTLIVKLDPEQPDLISTLVDRGLSDWYVFFDGQLMPGYSEGTFFEQFKTNKGSGRYLIAYIPYKLLEEIAETGGFGDQIGNGVVMTSSLRIRQGNAGDKIEVPKATSEPDIECEQGTVVVGIIDDGIAVAHERFRTSRGKSRVRFFWDQRERSEDTGPLTLPYGTQIEAREIDEAMKDSDEESFYRNRLSDLSNPNRPDTRLLRAATHGTHVLDLFAGMPVDSNNQQSATGVGPYDEMRPIIAVQLPPFTVADTSGISFSEQYVMSGLLYILRKAERFKVRGKPVPVVINFSFGTIAGPHDGTHQLERLFDEAVQYKADSDQIVRMVVPAGNSHQSRCHAEFKASHQKPQELNWRLQPEDHSPSWLHVWLPSGSFSGKDCPFGLTITPPSGEVLETHDLLKNQSIKLQLNTEENGGGVIGLVTYTQERGAGDNIRGHICIAVNPTAGVDSSSDIPLAPAGVWQIGLTLKQGIPASDVSIHAWIERDDSVMGHRVAGRQSYFDHPDYDRFDVQGRPVTHDNVSSVVKRKGLMNAIATGTNTVVVGAADGKSGKPTDYSAGGPLRQTVAGKSGVIRSVRREGVDLLAVADDSAIHRGIIAAGTRSGSTLALNGTSVAAPQVAREIADDLAANRQDSLNQLRLKPKLSAPVIAGSDPDESTRTGFGTIDGRRKFPARRECDQ